MLTFKQGQKPQGGAEQISYKEPTAGFRGYGGVAEWKITGIVTIKDRSDIPPKKETITFKFREDDNPIVGQGHEVSYLRKLIMGKEKKPTIYDKSPNAWMQDVPFSNPDDKPIPDSNTYSGGKRRKTRKQRKSRKGGKKSRKQRKSRKSSKKSHKRRTRKRRTR